jgi:hypothetical protein
MRIILSRKGMDSENGGIPSPILENKLITLPIPTTDITVNYSSLQAAGHNLGKLFSNLSEDPNASSKFAHLDPDLHAGSVKRQPGWLPIFGQFGAAETHLCNQGVTVGDLFLFFGWFREVECTTGIYRYIKEAPNLHVLFGWLQVGKIVSCTGQVAPTIKWAQQHPHFLGKYGLAFLATKKLALGGGKTGIPGAGVFNFSNELCLTDRSQHKRSLWRMPFWFYPRNGMYPMSYHRDQKKYVQGQNHVNIQTVAKGQEFVINCDQYPEAIGWAKKLIMKHGSNAI